LNVIGAIVIDISHASWMIIIYMTLNLAARCIYSLPGFYI